MLIIPCPHCGLREYTEFTYAGDARIERPRDPAAADDRAWADYVFVRDNPRGPHWELWQHHAGCRQWLAVHRDTLNHDVREALTMADFRAKAISPAANPGSPAEPV